VRLLPAPLPTPLPVELVGGDPAWRIALDLLIVLGTVGAALAAVWAARGARRLAEADRAAADRRAEEDRQALSDRMLDERRYEITRDALERRLDRLLAFAEEWEASVLIMDGADRRRAEAVARARLRAVPDELPVLRQAFLEQRVTDELVKTYSPLYDVAKYGDLQRAELYSAIELLQDELASHERAHHGGA
jgi:hypothetical protein